MKPAKPTVSSLIDTDPIYRAIVKAVGYGQKTCKEVIEAIKGVTEKHGQEAVAEASKELLDYEAAAGDRWCKIKPELHNACRMLLGRLPPNGRRGTSKPQMGPPEGKARRLATRVAGAAAPARRDRLRHSHHPTCSPRMPSGSCEPGNTPEGPPGSRPRKI